MTPLDRALLGYHPARRLTVLEWLRKVTLTGCQGGILAHALGTPIGGLPGLPDNVNAADQVIRACLAMGLIVQLGHQPTPELAFFGCGGLRVRPGKPTEHSRPVEFSYHVGPGIDAFLEAEEEKRAALKDASFAALYGRRSPF